MKSGRKILKYAFLKIIVICFPNPAKASSSEASHQQHPSYQIHARTSSEPTTDSAQSVSGRSNEEKQLHQVNKKSGIIKIWRLWERNGEIMKMIITCKGKMLSTRHLKPLRYNLIPHLLMIIIFMNCKIKMRI